ncbi:MAG: site-specific integrase [Burkholderiaceae bacterium]
MNSGGPLGSPLSCSPPCSPCSGAGAPGTTRAQPGIGSQQRKRGRSRDAEVFARASTHWLRHTFGRHAVSGGVKINLVQALLGHASLQTTTIYTSDDGTEAWDAVKNFTNKRL